MINLSDVIKDNYYRVSWTSLPELYWIIKTRADKRLYSEIGIAVYETDPDGKKGESKYCDDIKLMRNAIIVQATIDEIMWLEKCHRADQFLPNPINSLSDNFEIL